MMTGDEIKSLRGRIGLSVNDFAALLQLRNSHTVRKWESGEQPDIPGPAVVLCRLIDQSRNVRRRLGVAFDEDLPN